MPRDRYQRRRGPFEEIRDCDRLQKRANEQERKVLPCEPVVELTDPCHSATEGDGLCLESLGVGFDVDLGGVEEDVL